jgi:hypothetical protein
MVALIVSPIGAWECSQFPLVPLVFYMPLIVINRIISINSLSELCTGNTENRSIWATKTGDEMVFPVSEMTGNILGTLGTAQKGTSLSSGRTYTYVGFPFTRLFFRCQP